MNVKFAAKLGAELLAALLVALLGTIGVCLCCAIVFALIFTAFTETQILMGLWWMTWGMVGVLAAAAIYGGFKKIKQTKEELENGDSTNAGDSATAETE